MEGMNGWLNDHVMVNEVYSTCRVRRTVWCGALTSARQPQRERGWSASQCTQFDARWPAAHTKPIVRSRWAAVGMYRLPECGVSTLSAAVGIHFHAITIDIDCLSQQRPSCNRDWPSLAAVCPLPAGDCIHSICRSTSADR